MGDTFPLASSEINLVPAVQGVPGGCQALMDGQTDTKWLGKDPSWSCPLVPCPVPVFYSPHSPSIIIVLN